MKIDTVVELREQSCRLRFIDMEYDNNVDKALSSLKSIMKQCPTTDIFALGNIGTTSFAYKLLRRILDDPFCEIFFNFDHRTILLCVEPVNELKFSPYYFLPLENHAMVEFIFRVYSYDKQMNEVLSKKLQEKEGNIYNDSFMR